MKPSFWALLVLCATLLAGGPLREAVSAEPGEAALNSVQGLDYAMLSGGRIVIKVVFRHEIRKPPTLFKSYHPSAQIVLAFGDTVSALAKGPVEIGKRGLRSLQVVQSGTRTRLVINLLGLMVHETEWTGNVLLITLRRPDAGAAGEAAWRLSETVHAAPKHAVRNVGFQRGSAGEGRVIVELADAATPINVRRQGKALIVDFLDSALPPQLERRLDVGDFGTAVRAIEAYRLGNNVRMKIELEGAGDYIAYQASGSFVVSPR
jgi:type IV pilus assembly protein PilQ